MASPNLAIPHLAPTQTDKTTTMNLMVDAVDNATQGQSSIDMSGGDVTLSAAQFTAAAVFIVTGLTATRTLNTPISKRVFVVRNPSAQDVVVKAGTGSTVTVLAGNGAILQNDGAQNIVSFGAGGPGAPGAIWRTGSGVPSNSLGIDGDFYLNTANGAVYERVSGVYALQTNITGPAGATGATGPAGVVTANDGVVLNSGTISLATVAASTLLGNPGTGTAAPSTAVSIGTGLTLSTAGTLSATASSFNEATAFPDNSRFELHVLTGNVDPLPAHSYAGGTGGVGATITMTSNGVVQFDGLSVQVGDSLLIGGDGSTAAENGVYTVTQVGDVTHPLILTRHVRANSQPLLNNLTVTTSGQGGDLYTCRFQAVGFEHASAVVGSSMLSWTLVGGGAEFYGNVIGPGIAQSSTGLITTVSADWQGGSVTTIGNGLVLNSGTITADSQASQTITTSTATITPTAGTTAINVTLQANTTLTIAAGYDGQRIRLKLIQDATGSRTVAFGASVKFGTDLTSFTASTAANAIDLVQLIYDGAHSRWMFTAVNHGF